MIRKIIIENSLVYYSIQAVKKRIYNYIKDTNIEK